MPSRDGATGSKKKIFCGQQPEPEVEETEDTGKNRKAVWVKASNLIKWLKPGYGMTWREKYNVLRFNVVCLVVKLQFTLRNLFFFRKCETQIKGSV